ncbi:SDR family oxidoreductase [Streptomyces beihaiensis]|uniref:NAD(P)H-binding protein n=1 Tax=Streptomyces beihaiensis TaxID=2984495 RepID=A0ABT3U3X0_9ACTN|nr:NAD(P)H-binding protein [Streptomyces beihaiensis]MCX3064027.1 NAD(P)H-binding protein [Streptomyces beihaiensis]
MTKKTILVTGGTGTLGRALVRRLAADHDDHTRVLTRAPEPTPATAALDGRSAVELMTGDLMTGVGVGEAVAGADVIVHCATTNGRDDVVATRHLVDAALGAGRRPHLIYVSIVGVDVVPLSYYRAKLEAEQLITESGLPWTIQRVTQFHDLLARVFAAQRLVPWTTVPAGFRFQPIDVRDVARRLADLVAGEPAGRAPDLGGPQVRTMRDLAKLYRRRPVLRVPLPGATARAIVQGGNLAPGHAYGEFSFDDFVAGR